MVSTMTVQAVRQLPLFAGVSDEESRCLEGGEEISLNAGETLAVEGDPAEHFFVILEGEVRITKRYGRQEIALATHTPGKFFGEVPLLLEMPFFVDARALKACRLLRFRKSFWTHERFALSGKLNRRTMATGVFGIWKVLSAARQVPLAGTMASVR